MEIEILSCWKLGFLLKKKLKIATIKGNRFKITG
jgi:hypothetical protein